LEQFCKPLYALRKGFLRLLSLELPSLDPHFVPVVKGCPYRHVADVKRAGALTLDVTSLIALMTGERGVASSLGAADIHWYA